MDELSVILRGCQLIELATLSSLGRGSMPWVGWRRGSSNLVLMCDRTLLSVLRVEAVADEMTVRTSEFAVGGRTQDVLVAGREKAFILVPSTMSLSPEAVVLLLQLFLTTWVRDSARKDLERDAVRSGSGELQAALSQGLSYFPAKNLSSEMYYIN